MPQSRTAFMHLADPLIALGLLTRLPVSVPMDLAKERGARPGWAYPIVGLVVGLIGVITYSAMAWLGLSNSVAAALTIVAMVMTTGALHEDGLADCADGFWGGWTREKRLEIMHDSRIGAYGVLALGLAILLRWQAIIDLSGQWAALIAGAVLSRMAMLVVWTLLPPARKDGLARSIGKPPILTAAIAFGLATLIAVLLLGSNGIIAILAALTGAAIVAAVAYRRIGGQTGDVMGATQQVSEIFCLLALGILA